MPVCETHPPDVVTAPGHRALCWLYAPGAGNGPGPAAGPPARAGAS